MIATPIKMLITSEEFFFVPLKKMRIESCPVANRTYFLDGDRIVAVATLA